MPMHRGRRRSRGQSLFSTGTLGADPQAMAQTLFGISEPVEGNCRRR